MKKSISLPKAARRGVVSSQRAAAAALDVTTKTLRAWRAEGAPGFSPDGEIDLGLLSGWVTARRQRQRTPSDLRSRKTSEEIRKLKLANDLKSGRLVERAWVTAAIQRMAGDLNQYRTRSEAEHPTLFAAAGGDVALCRIQVRKIWDEVFTGLQSLAHHLKDARS